MVLHVSVVLGEKRLSPRRGSAAGGSLLPLSPRRTQVRLIPLLYQVSGHRLDVLPPPRRPLQRKSTVRGLSGCLPRLINSRGTLYFNPQPVSANSRLLGFPGLLPRVALLAFRFRLKKYAQHYVFDRNRTSKKVRQLPKPRLSAAAHRTN